MPGPWNYSVQDQSPNILFIGIGDQDMKRFGDWPWPRKLQADLLATFTNEDFRPAVIAYDMMFTSAKEDEPGKQSDAAFAAMIQSLSNVCLAATITHRRASSANPSLNEWLTFHSIPQDSSEEENSFQIEEEIHAPAELFRKESFTGTINCEPDPDGIRRRSPLVYPIGNRWFPSLALRSMMLYYGLPLSSLSVEPGKAIVLNKNEDGWPRRIPIDSEERLLINYRGNMVNFHNLSFSAIVDWMDPAKRNETAEVGQILAQIKEGIVLIGSTATGQAQDSGATPLIKSSPLAVVHLNIMANIRNQDYLRPTPWWMTLTLSILLAVAASWLTQRFTPIRATLLDLGLITLYLTVTFLGILFGNYWIPWVVPVLSGVLGASAVGVLRLTGVEEKTEELTSAFQTYFSANLTKERIKHAAKSGESDPTASLVPEALAEFAQVRVDSPIIGIGKYNLLCKLGQGGMGAVFLSRQRILKQYCAIKVLSAEFSEDPEITQRFLREARTMAGLSHPNVVNLYDCDQVEGQYFIAMEYVEGLSLMDIIREQAPLPLPLALHWIYQAAAGLEYIHGKNLIHRDIKPDNMLIDCNAVLKLTDMGLAKNKMDADKGLTVTGTVMGSPHYISPEQINDSKSVDARTDIYSLGISLFQLITGNVPFPGTSVGAVCVAHLQDPIPSVQNYQPDLYAYIDPLISKMAAKDVNDRFQSATEVLETLKPWIEQYPIDAISQDSFAMLSFSERTVSYRLQSEGIDFSQIDLDFGSMLAAKDDLTSES
jgi:serine/threonine protein kinase/CHASE2 domain-containing sensor protein